MKIIFFFALVQFSLLTMGRQTDSTAKASEISPGGHHSKMLAAMMEPALSDDRSGLEVYRLTWLRTFEAPVMVRIQKSGINTFTATLITLSGRGGYEPGVIESNTSFEIDKRNWKSIQKKIKKSDFWNQPCRTGNAGFDGEEWVLEGMKNNKYHFMTRWSPEEKSEFGKCCLNFLDLAGVKLKRMSEEQIARLEDLEDKAEDFYDDSAYNKAIATYKRVAKKSAPNSDSYRRALLQIAEIYTEKKNYAAARKQYDHLISLATDDQQMIARKLVNMELSFRNYTNALTVLNNDGNYVPARSFCGNFYAEKTKELAELYFHTYLGLKDSVAAIRAILPEMFYNGLVQNDELVDYVLPVFIGKYGRTFLINELDKGAMNIVKTEKSKGPPEYQTTMFGVVVPIPEFYQSFRMTDFIPAPSSPLEKRKYAITKSYFYSKVCAGHQL